MTLSAGTRFGTLEVVSLLGAGGMEEVYRVRDTRLNREVALKVLPARVAGDPERMTRFTREAQVLAALNHPNIAVIFGIEHADGRDALVPELVEGPTLADRIASGPLPLDEVLSIARQVADQRRRATVAVPMTITTSALSPGAPRQLFESRGLGSTGPARGYDVAPDGMRFLFTRVVEAPPRAPERLVIVENWIEELTRGASAQP